MSFSADTKAEICKIAENNACCKRSQLAGFVSFAGVCSEDDLKISTENAGVARLIYTAFKEFFKISPVCDIKKFGHCHLYTNTMSGAVKVLAQIEVERAPMRIPPYVFDNDCCRRAFARAAFLVSGSVTLPTKTYHMEFVTRNHKLCEDFCVLLGYFDLKAKIAIRKGCSVVYFKGSEPILDMFALFGANNMMMQFLNTKILKEVRNNANRLVNCETANVEKSVSASLKQVDAIKKIREREGLESLPPGLREVAGLRLEFPDDSLLELGERCEPVLSKSGVKHRMDKIMEIAGAYI